MVVVLVSREREWASQRGESEKKKVEKRIKRKKHSGAQVVKLKQETIAVERDAKMNRVDKSNGKLSSGFLGQSSKLTVRI